MRFNKKIDISRLSGGFLKLMDKFIYFGSSESSTENDISMRLAKVWIVTDRLSIVWKSVISDKIKCNFFPAAVVIILLYRRTTWTLTKRIEKNLYRNCSRMLRAILNKSLKQHPTKQHLYGHLPPISKTIQIGQRRHAGHCWKSRNKPISDVLPWTILHGHESIGRPRTYLQLFCTDAGCNLENLPDLR